MMELCVKDQRLAFITFIFPGVFFSGVPDAEGQLKGVNIRAGNVAAVNPEINRAVFAVVCIVRSTVSNFRDCNTIGIVGGSEQTLNE